MSSLYRQGFHGWRREYAQDAPTAGRVAFNLRVASWLRAIPTRRIPR